MVGAKRQLTEGSISRALFNMAAPMTIALLATMSFNIVDTYFVSGLGGDALAALSFPVPVIMFILSLAIGLGAGTSSVVARAAGSHDDDAIKVYITDSIALSALLSILLCILGLATIDPLFRALGADEQVLPLIHEYMFIWYFSAPFMVVPMVAMAALRALGNTGLQANVMIAMALLNAALDPIFIYGWGGFPRMEIAGAAWASFLVRIISVFVLAYFFVGKHQLLVSPFHFDRMLASWKKILHVGLPASATNMIIPASGAIIIALVARNGWEAVAGFGAATRVEAVALICFYALSAVIGPFVGQNLSAGHYHRLGNAQNISARFCCLVGFGSALLLALSGEWIGQIFSDNPRVIEITRFYLLLVPLSYFAYGVVMVVNASFNGLGKPFPGVVLSSARVIVFLFPLAWLANYFYGVKGIFFAIAASNILAGAWAFIWIHHTVKRLTVNVD